MPRILRADIKRARLVEIGLTTGRKDASVPLSRDERL